MDEEDLSASELRLGTETWDLYSDLIDLWAIYTTTCRGSESDGLQFVLRQAVLLRELADYPAEIVHQVARDLGRTHRHFGVVQWVQQVRAKLARRVQWHETDFELPTTALLRFWKSEPPPFWRAARRLPRTPTKTTEAFNEMTALAAFIDETYPDHQDGLIAAADRVVAGYLVWAEDLADLPDTIKRAADDVAQRMRSGVLGNMTLERLDSIRVLLPDPSPQGRSTLARRFREIARPDLAIAVTSAFDVADPHHQYAVVVRAAAHLDLRDFDAAEGDANAVWSQHSSHAAAVVLSKSSRLRGHDDQNLEWAFAAWDLERNAHTARNLVTASLLTTPHARQQDITEAHEILQAQVTAKQALGRDAYVIIRSARLLFGEGRIDVATRVAEEILAHNPEYFPAKQLLLDIRLVG